MLDVLKKCLIGIKHKFKDNINYIYINVYMQNQLKNEGNSRKN
jgi:hypothetical protein